MPDAVPLNQLVVKNRFPWKLALPLYGLSNVIMLLFLRSYFWEDWWTYYSNSNDEIKHRFRSLGNQPTRGFIELDVLGNRPELFKILTIVCFFFAGWFLFHILSTVRILSTDQVRLITILFLILPINSARVAMIIFLYSYSLFLFYFAWYLLITKRSRYGLVLSIPLFLLSFNTNAFIAFFAVPCAHLLYMKLSAPESNRWKAYLSTALFATLSPLYWIIDRRYNAPQEPFVATFTPQKLGILRGLLLLGVCTALFIRVLKSRKRDTSETRRYIVIVTGITITVIGVFPYMVGGRFVDISDWLFPFVPRLSDWDSRNQLILGLGIAITIAGLIGSIDSRFKRQSLAVFYGICVMWNMTYMHSYYLDALKQDQIVAAFRRSGELKSARVIMIDDLTDRYNARGRRYRHEEWGGLLSMAFGENSRSAISGKSYVDCSRPLIPDTLLTITARNGRLESTLSRDLGIEISLESIQPCK